MDRCERIWCDIQIFLYPSVRNMVIITYSSAADAKDIILNNTKPAIYAFLYGSGTFPLDIIEFISPPKNW